MEKINWEDAVMEVCRRLAKFEYLADKGKDVLSYIPNGVETAEISIRAAEIYTDVTKRHSN